MQRLTSIFISLSGITQKSPIIIFFKEKKFLKHSTYHLHGLQLVVHDLTLPSDDHLAHQVAPCVRCLRQGAP